MPRKNVCAVCFAPTTKRCTRCRIVHYCTADHQSLAHRRHKKFCKAWISLDEATVEAAITQRIDELKATWTIPPRGTPRCWICLEEGGDDMLPTGCACRDAYLHGRCAETLCATKPVSDPIHSGYCMTCHQRFEGPLALVITAGQWRRLKDDAGAHWAFHLNLGVHLDDRKKPLTLEATRALWQYVIDVAQPAGLADHPLTLQAIHNLHNILLRTSTPTLADIDTALPSLRGLQRHLLTDAEFYAIADPQHKSEHQQWNTRFQRTLARTLLAKAILLTAAKPKPPSSELEDAGVYFREALDIGNAVVESTTRRLGPRHLYTLEAMDILALARFLSGGDQKIRCAAIRYFHTAVCTPGARIFGPDHANTRRWLATLQFFLRNLFNSPDPSWIPFLSGSKVLYFSGNDDLQSFLKQVLDLLHDVYPSDKDDDDDDDDDVATVV